MKILVATDGTEHGRYAVDQAIGLAGPTGAGLTIVYVRHAPAPVLGDPFYQRSLSAGLRHAEEVAAEAERQAADAGVDAEVEVLEGPPAHSIVEFARARDVDLIVVGSRGRGPVAGTLLGSVSGEVMRHADRPVLLATHRVPRKVAA